MKKLLEHLGYLVDPALESAGLHRGGGVHPRLDDRLGRVVSVAVVICLISSFILQILQSRGLSIVRIVLIRNILLLILDIASVDCCLIISHWLNVLLVLLVI